MPPEAPSLKILKIGGSVLTDRSVERPRVRRALLARLAAEIAAAWRAGGFRLLLIHGAGSFGHPIVRRTGIERGLANESHRIAFAETQRLQSVLNGIVVRALLREGLPAFPFQASANAVLERGEIRSFSLEAVAGLLSWGLVPVLNGVPAVDVERGCSILSGDVLAGHLAARLGAVELLHGTDVRGIYSADPATDPAARFLPQIDLRAGGVLPTGIGGSTATDVTGGMRKKLEELGKTKARCQVFDATFVGNVRRALSGGIVGTLVVCD
ncbi:MAG: isopentenyl phosphate kinase [bacterium]